MPCILLQLHKSSLAKGARTLQFNIIMHALIVSASLVMLRFVAGHGFAMCSRKVYGIWTRSLLQPSKSPVSGS